MPTSYPKCSPTEMMGLLVLLDSHKGQDDIARLADDLDLEIDEILPALDFAEALGFVKVVEGQATLSETGRRLLSGSIRERKAVIREQLKRTTLFYTLARALENAPRRRLAREEFTRLVEFATSPSEEVVQNIVNWGRYADLFRTDAQDNSVVLVRRSTPPKPPAGGKGSSQEPPPAAGRKGDATSGAGSYPKLVPVSLATA